MISLLSLSLVAGLACMDISPERSDRSIDEATAGRFARLALDCVHRPYPNKISHVMLSDDDARVPNQLTPVFYGCFDWHSAVHGHWLLVRLMRQAPDSDMNAEIEAALNKSFTPEAVAAEVSYIDLPDRVTFERPYGLAWLLQLCAELRQWDDPRATQWAKHLQPLEQLAANRFKQWLPKLAYAIRTGEHSQSAFALGLAYDWSVIAGDEQLKALITEKALAFHLNDQGCPLRFEPSGQDFLSPCLAVADLMRRVLEPAPYAAWLGRFMPQIPYEENTDWLPLAIVTDPGDGKLAHLDGLNLSRAWMLEGMAMGLPEGDPRKAVLSSSALQHLESGTAAVGDIHYEGSHWLGSFAVYALTQRGLK